jgi:uncharacterized protein
VTESDAPESTPILEPARPPGPVPESARIAALDVARGFALLGIFLVNIQSFGEPVGSFMEPAPRPGTPWSELIALYFVKIFCESKFYPLFSLLFGIGFALQFDRARQAGQRFFRIGLRRLFFLWVFGVLHAVLFWYGDVLHLYAMAGVLILFMAGCRPRTLAITAAVLVLIGLAGIAVGSAFMGAPPEHPSTVTDVPHLEDPFGTLWNALKRNELPEGPAAALWMQAETQAYREGPYQQLFLIRLLTWVAFVVFELFGTLFFVAALFLIGAALLKAGLFLPENRRWRVRLLRLGLFVGLPLAAVAAFIPSIVSGGAGMIVAAILVAVGGPLMSLGYLVGWTLAVEDGRCRFMTRALANAGRMALTNYLMQTVIATTIFYFYGLALFARTTRVERLGIVLAVFAGQLLFSALWLRYFQFGPMEWLWRSLTYRRRPPFLRGTEVAV